MSLNQPSIHPLQTQLSPRKGVMHTDVWRTGECRACSSLRSRGVLLFLHSPTGNEMFK